MGEYKTPGVYIIEKNAFPNSVVEAATAIPAFIGITEKARNGNDDLKDKPWKITSMTEFVNYFGGAPQPEYNLNIVKYVPKDGKPKAGIFQYAVELEEVIGDTAGTTKKVTNGYAFGLNGSNFYTLYYNMVLFFANGGSCCYVVSVGTYADGKKGGKDDKPTIDALLKDGVERGLSALEKIQEVTMIVVPEAVNVAGCKDIQTAMLSHCGLTMKNRFALLDVQPKEKETDQIQKQIETFHTNIGSNNLSFGAAYFPWLNTSVVADRDIDPQKMIWDASFFAYRNQIFGNEPAAVALIDTFITKVILIEGDAEKKKIGDNEYNYADLTPTEITTLESKGIIVTEGVTEVEKKTKVVTIPNQADVILIEGDDTPKQIGDVNYTYADLTTEVIATLKPKGMTVTEGVIKTEKKAKIAEIPNTLTEEDKSSLHFSLLNNSRIYKSAIKTLKKTLNLLPPSAAMAGIYTMVDNTRGVWKAPANVTLSYVDNATEDIDDTEQADLNAPMNGKAINVIRAFQGEGLKVWGARTLDGNSLDWRYVNVRRTMLFLEESVKNAARAYVFEPNVASTWMNMKCMIENFLKSVWKRGGLAGTSPEDAYEVHVGLGDTMTPDDILEGILRITVLVAISHPAEFIEITFQQQMQKS